MERDRMKAKLKTEPTGVRFDISKLQYIKTREGLNTAQQVVSFLVDEYWWRYKVKGMGTAPEIKQEVPVVFSVPVENMVVPKTVQDYILEKRTIEDRDEYEAFLKRVAADTNLTYWQRLEIKTA